MTPKGGWRIGESNAREDEGKYHRFRLAAFEIPGVFPKRCIIQLFILSSPRLSTTDIPSFANRAHYSFLAFLKGIEVFTHSASATAMFKNVLNFSYLSCQYSAAKKHAQSLTSVFGMVYARVCNLSYSLRIRLLASV